MPPSGSRAPLSAVPFEATTDDLHFALAACTRRRSPLGEVATLLGDPAVVVTASARAAFDLLLECLELPAGTEVLFTPTIPAMPAIARAHGLVPVALDIDPASLAPDLEALARALGPRVGAGPRLLVVAHLFGARPDVTAAIRLAHAHGVLVIEDRAQAFHDPKDRGNAEADAVIHSFGILKTASALGGAATRVRDPELRVAMSRTHATWPEQRSATYARTVALHLAVRLFATRETHAAAIRASAKLHTDLDAIALELVCSPFQRERPSPALLAMLERRLTSFDPSSIRDRIAAARRLMAHLPPGIIHVGGSIAAHTHWVLPIAVPRPRALVTMLRRAGLHATTKAIALEDGAGRPARGLLGDVVYLPFAPSATDHEMAVMRAIMEAHVRTNEQTSRRDERTKPTEPQFLHRAPDSRDRVRIRSVEERMRLIGRGNNRRPSSVPSQMPENEAMSRGRRLAGPAALIASAGGLAAIALADSAWIEWGLLAFSGVVALAGVGLGRRSMTAQVLSRGTAWTVLAPSALVTAVSTLGNHHIEWTAVGLAATSGAALLLSRPMLNSTDAHAQFAPSSFRRWLLSGAIGSAAAGVVTGVFGLDAWHFHPGAMVGLLALSLSLLASAVGVVKMRAWGILLGAATSIAALVAALSMHNAAGFGLALTALPGLMLLLPVLIAKRQRAKADAASRTYARIAPHVSYDDAPSRVRVASDSADAFDDLHAADDVRATPALPSARAQA